jgi:hypothetical protein
MSTVPQAAVAVFVGTEFDSLSGRGGDDGTPVRKTPWGEIAFQLGGAEALAVLVEHEKQLTAPAGDIIRKFLPQDTPCLILMDELMNYVSRNRKSGMATQLYNFLQNLSEEARGHNHLVLVVSILASELEMNTDDHADYERFKKMLDRLGKAVMMSAKAETSEIIRRRLFEWDERAVSRRESAAVARCPADVQRVCGMGGRAPTPTAGLVSHRSGTGCLRRDLSLPPAGPLGLRAEMASAPTVPTHPWHPAPPGPVGL